MLKEMPKVGDKVRYIGRNKDWMTMGEDYEVAGVDAMGDAFVHDNDGEVEFVMEHRFGDYELTHTTPDTAALIANLALRVSELESEVDYLRLQNKQQAHEINELCRADAERGC